MENRVISQNKLIPSPRFSKNLQKPNLRFLKVEEIANSQPFSETRSPYLNEFQITLETDAVALYVWLETDGKKYSF